MPSPDARQAAPGDTPADVAEQAAAALGDCPQAPPYQFSHLLRVEPQFALCHPAYQSRAVGTARSKSIPSRPQAANLTWPGAATNRRLRV